MEFLEEARSFTTIMVELLCLAGCVEVAFVCQRRAGGDLGVGRGVGLKWQDMKGLMEEVVEAERSGFIVTALFNAGQEYEREIEEWRSECEYDGAGRCCGGGWGVLWPEAERVIPQVKVSTMVPNTSYY